MAALLVCGTFACQQEQNTDCTEAATASEKTEPIVLDTTATVTTPPKKIDHKIPTDKAKERVYVCGDGMAEYFHLNFECPLLQACNANYKNISVIRAVEDYNCTFCPECGVEMAEYFEFKDTLE
ncbi:MAG: hypothetical protein LPJ89_03490 [Hymenobacteraceae bacterium]|nr:hypothetical protein [Hymenobacteraceae bacterium]MDX5396635.1 hypothetical protein [Hymenobacteraceae bacterium]MDX5442827.1 hypothetical protein [Hymenobacteraceae bacterium]MDX5512702.1 hypothetical protein [Hymenobacteraceae bacterium]